ncbi:hypothetical protein LguiB_004591 [Lonicera macranthoides]
MHLQVIVFWWFLNSLYPFDLQSTSWEATWDLVCLTDERRRRAIKGWLIVGSRYIKKMRFSISRDNEIVNHEANKLRRNLTKARLRQNDRSDEEFLHCTNIHMGSYSCNFIRMTPSATFDCKEGEGAMKLIRRTNEEQRITGWWAFILLSVDHMEKGMRKAIM